MVGELLHDEMVSVLGTTMIGHDHPTARQRALVAALVLAGSAGVDIEELADEVWAGRPPPSARASLQNQMTRLRRRYGNDLIVSEGRHYRIGWTTDVAVLEGLVASPSAKPLASRVASLAEALHRWRDLPYADLDSHAADVERARLSQLRCRCVEELALGRLEIGQSTEAVTDLRAEIELDPYRDRTWELLAIALHRGGRRAEALHVLADYATRLREEFGAEPSPAMEALTSRIRGGGEPVSERSRAPFTGRPGHSPRLCHARRCRSRRTGGSRRSES